MESSKLICQYDDNRSRAHISRPSSGNVRYTTGIVNGLEKYQSETEVSYGVLSGICRALSLITTNFVLFTCSSPRQGILKGEGRSIIPPPTTLLAFTREREDHCQFIRPGCPGHCWSFLVPRVGSKGNLSNDHVHKATSNTQLPLFHLRFPPTLHVCGTGS